MTAIARFEAACDSIAQRKREQMRSAFRAGVREAVEQFSREPSGLLYWLAQIWPAPLQFYSTDEAVRWLSKRVRQERAKIATDHWSKTPDRLAALQKRLIVARFFRIHGRRLWSNRIAEGRSDG